VESPVASLSTIAFVISYHSRDQIATPGVNLDIEDWTNDDIDREEHLTRRRRGAG